jgi:squalene-hopene/tetraprenyl-beta-curcumene cyclase
VNDGGFYYVIPTEKVDPSDSERVTANGGLRSYGSMTYAGFKSLLYADLTKNDPRTQAALKWISDNYSVTENPGQGTAGLFYYYQLFGSALDASQLEELNTRNAGDRSWREDLITELSKTQRPDGSWMNANRQWMENDPNLCTAFALIALAHCNDQPVKNQRP